MKSSRMFAVLVVPILAACGDIDFFGIGGRDFEGFYAYAGTVDEAIGDAVVGQFTITRQRGDNALIAIEWSYLDGGDEIVHITTDEPALADLGPDGRIRFDFEGDLITNERVVSFRLEHDGDLRGRTMTGFWRFVTGLPTEDQGTFTARRN